jgi:hypothetical protein
MTVHGGLIGTRPQRRIGAGGRTLGATVARLDAATLAVDRLSRGLPLRALYDAMRPLLEVPLDLDMLAAILDRTSCAPVPRAEALPANVWRPSSGAGQRPAGPRAWSTSDVRTPRSLWGPTARDDKVRQPFDQPATVPPPERLSALTPPTVQHPGIPDGSADSAPRSRSQDQTTAHPSVNPASAVFESSAHIPNARTEGAVRQALSSNSPLQPLASQQAAIRNTTVQPHPAQQATERLETSVAPPAEKATRGQHETVTTSEPALFGALGELIRRVDQMSADPLESSHQAHSAPPLAADDSLDALEEALEVLIRRDAERHGIAGWAP